MLGADGLMYQEVDDLIAVGKSMNSAIERFDASCFDGHYCTGEGGGRAEGERRESGGRAEGERRESTTGVRVREGRRRG